MTRVKAAINSLAKPLALLKRVTRGSAAGRKRIGSPVIAKGRKKGKKAEELVRPAYTPNKGKEEEEEDKEFVI